MQTFDEFQLWVEGWRAKMNFAGGLLAKLDEESIEVAHAVLSDDPIEHIEEEIGDVLVVLAGIAQWQDTSLRHCIERVLPKLEQRAKEREKHGT